MRRTGCSMQMACTVCPRSRSCSASRTSKTARPADVVEAGRPEGALRVDHDGHAFGAAGIDWQLARHRERVAELRLAGAELAIELGEAARLDAAAQHLVEGLAANANAQAGVLVAHAVLGGRHEVGARARRALARRFDDLVGLYGVQ